MTMLHHGDPANAGLLFASVASPAAMDKLTEALLHEMAASRLDHNVLASVFGALFGGQLWERANVRCGPQASLNFATPRHSAF